MTSHGISIQGSQKKSKKKNTGEDSLGLSLNKPKIQSDIGSRLTKRFSLSRPESIHSDPRKKVRFRVDSTEESQSDNDLFSEFRSQETFVKLSSENYQEGHISEALEVVNPDFHEEKFNEKNCEIFHEENHIFEEKEFIEKLEESVAKSLEENIPKNRLSQFFGTSQNRTEKLGSLQRFKTLFTSKDKAFYDIEVKPKEDNLDDNSSEFVTTHISNRFQIADKEFEHHIVEKDANANLETKLDFQNNLQDFEKESEVIDEFIEVENDILSEVKNNLENCAVEIETSEIPQIRECSNLNETEIPTSVETQNNGNLDINKESISHISNHFQVADQELESLIEEKILEEEKSKVSKLQKVSNFEEDLDVAQETPKVTLESFGHISNHFQVADQEFENQVREKVFEEPKAVETSIFHVSNHFRIADKELQKQVNFVEKEVPKCAEIEITEEKSDLKFSENWTEGNIVEVVEPNLSQSEFIPCGISFEKSNEELENHEEKIFDDNFCFDQSAVHIKFEENQSPSEVNFEAKFEDHFEQKIEVNKAHKCDEDVVDGNPDFNEEANNREAAVEEVKLREDQFDDLSVSVVRESEAEVQFGEVEDASQGITYVPKQGVFPTKKHLK